MCGLGASQSSNLAISLSCSAVWSSMSASSDSTGTMQGAAQFQSSGRWGEPSHVMDAPDAASLAAFSSKSFPNWPPKTLLEWRLVESDIPCLWQVGHARYAASLWSDGVASLSLPLLAADPSGIRSRRSSRNMGTDSSSCETYNTMSLPIPARYELLIHTTSSLASLFLPASTA